MLRAFRRSLGALCLLAPSLGLSAALVLDEALPAYRPSQVLEAQAVTSVGSDTMNNLMSLWSEAFQAYHGGLSVQISGAGSSTAPPALTEGTALFGAMSRRMTSGELQAFEARFGYRPLAFRVAVDALAVFVHKDNPLPGLSLSTLDAIFSVARRCGARRSAERWGDLGLEGPWTTKRLQRYGRNAVSGTYGYFKSSALCNGDFRSDVNEQPGSASVVQAVSRTPTGIGYSGMGFQTSGIRPLPLARRDGEPFVAATAANAIAGTYPLSRYLYLYLNHPPGTTFAPLQREFLRFVLSREGQSLVLRDGYVPLPAKVAARERLRVP
ncbi:MAG: phosphate ABC transporter substrate-binding protein [Pseudomonadales bacterium]|jgi:phosphate transport system substrate-binding protein